MKKWSSQWTQFMESCKEAWKKIQDFNGVWTHDLTITAAMLYQLSYEATDVGSRSIVGSYFPVKEMSVTDIWNKSYMNCRNEMKNSSIHQFIHPSTLQLTHTMIYFPCCFSFKQSKQSQVDIPLEVTLAAWSWIMLCNREIMMMLAKTVPVFASQTNNWKNTLTLNWVGNNTKRSLPKKMAQCSLKMRIEIKNLSELGSFKVSRLDFFGGIPPKFKH